MNLFVIYPEIFLLIMACLVALLDLWSQDPLRQRAYLATLMTLAALALAQVGRVVGVAGYAGVRQALCAKP
jgi:NADH-quinone oxidoreductase subunit N